LAEYSLLADKPTAMQLVWHGLVKELQPLEIVIWFD
jgi:hypothetical protein